MAAEGGEKSEKATPKKRDDARKQGQVAKSMDVNGSIVLLATLGVLAATGSMMYGRMAAAMRDGFTMISDPSVVAEEGLGEIFKALGTTIAWCVGPVAATAMLTGFLVSVMQVKWKPSMKIIKPQPKKLNPIQGAKGIFGKRALFELAKNLVKVGAVGAVVAFAVLPRMDELAALVGLPPAALAAELVREILHIAFRAAGAYFVIGLADYGWQKYETEKNLKMSKEDVKQEFKNQEQSGEVKSAIKRRQMQGARARMMADVPEADVIVTNPTHYSVALRYTADSAAPVVVAKGKDIIAFKIREIAAEHGVPIVPDPPLARSLHASVEVGHAIPEEMFAAVAQLLAYVYRTAGRRSLAAA